MARQNKPHTAITIKMEQELYDALCEYCNISGQTKTMALERALKMFIQNYEEKEHLKIIKPTSSE